MNKFILDGIYCTGFDLNVAKTVEEWSLYTPPCPHLRPVHYPESIRNPNCEDSTLQFVNMEWKYFLAKNIGHLTFAFHTFIYLLYY